MTALTHAVWESFSISQIMQLKKRHRDRAFFGPFQAHPTPIMAKLGQKRPVRRCKLILAARQGGAIGVF